MPLYEYKCEECGLRFERRQHFSDDPVKICPDCSGAVVRLIQPAGIIFKGNGFYQTDYRSDNYKSAAKADKPSWPSSASSPEPTAAPFLMNSRRFNELAVVDRIRWPFRGRIQN